jgi:hypothetical protein
LADLTLRINSDFEQASKAFKELAESSEATREKIEKFSNGFQTEHLDKFIDKQKLLEASLTGTRGEVDAMTAAKKNYEKEIERLIRSGLDPESEAIQKLRDEHDKLADKIKETNEVQKKQEELMKGAEKAALGMIAAIGAGVVAMAAAAQKTAEAGDQYAKTARVIGMTAETFQELDYAAKMSGIDNLDSSLQRLNKSVADVKSNTGALTSYLNDNDQELLNQLKNVKSNEEAFNLLMDAIGKAPDEFSRAELAQAAFGKSGQQLILLANESANGISALREEARKYGVISNEAAANSEAYLDAQARLKASLAGVTTELTKGLMPGLTETITKIADFIAEIDNWEGILSTAGYALAGVTSGLIAFLVVTKGTALINGLAIAFKALTAAIASNPLGAIAVLVTAVLIPALIALYKNWDTVSTYLQQGIARIQFAFKWLGSVIEEGLVVAFNTVKSAAVTLVDFIHGNIIRAVGNMLEIFGKLPFVGDLFLEASNKVKTLGNAIGNLAEETKQSSRDAIQAAHDKQNATEAELNTTLSTIDKEAQARRRAIEEQKKNNQELSTNVETINNDIVKDTIETQSEISDIVEEGTKGATTKITTLLDKLGLIPITESQLLGEQLNQINSFLDQRLNLERLNGEERIAWLQEQQEKILALETISDEEKYAATIAINDRIKEEEEKLIEEKIESFTNFLNERLEQEQLDGEERITWLKEQSEQLKEIDNLNANERVALEKVMAAKILSEETKLKDSQQKLLNEKLKATSQFFKGIEDLASVASEKSIGLLIMEKAAASAQALINSYLAFTNALATVPFPFNYVAAAGVLASGIAQQVKILSTPIPSAETGGRFIVPNGVGSDSQIMRVNPGEEIDVTPRGMVGNNSQNIIVQIDKQPIFDIVNDGIRSGDILIQAANF